MFHPHLSGSAGVRGAAAAVALAGSLLTAGVASAAGAPTLDRQLSAHLAPHGQATFQLPYDGAGDVTEIAVLPSVPGAGLSVRVLGPDGRPVELYPDSNGFGTKALLVGSAAGTYTVEVLNGAQVTDVSVSADESAIAPPSSDQGSASSDAGSAGQSSSEVGPSDQPSN